jgi:2-dehydro-3-deoxygluconokinase
MFDVVSFGEVQLRLCTPHFQRLEQATSFDVNIGGAEFNMAVTVQRLGLKTAYVTRLPENPLGRMASNKVREQGVDASHILWTDGDRLGVYFLELGALPRTSAILYDRAGSAISKIKPGMVDWDSIFSQTRAFHMTGITPALSGSALKTSAEALNKAKEKGVLVSFDLNYRAKLWTQEQAKAGLTPLMKNVDILITTEEDTARVFQIEGKDWKEVGRKLVDAFGFKVVAITLRENITVWRNNWTAIVLKDDRTYEDRTYEIEVVDRVGSGDAFAGGFIYAYLTRDGDIEAALKYGNAAAVLKHSCPGDLAWFTLEEVEKLMASKGDLRISR